MASKFLCFEHHRLTVSIPGDWNNTNNNDNHEQSQSPQTFHHQWIWCHEWSFLVEWTFHCEWSFFVEWFLQWVRCRWSDRCTRNVFLLFWSPWRWTPQSRCTKWTEFHKWCIVSILRRWCVPDSHICVQNRWVNFEIFACVSVHCSWHGKLTEARSSEDVLEHSLHWSCILVRNCLFQNITTLKLEW